MLWSRLKSCAHCCRRSSPDLMHSFPSCLPDLRVSSWIKLVHSYQVWDFTLETKLSLLVKRYCIILNFFDHVMSKNIWWFSQYFDLLIFTLRFQILNSCISAKYCPIHQWKAYQMMCKSKDDDLVSTIFRDIVKNINNVYYTMNYMRPWTIKPVIRVHFFKVQGHV